MSPRRDEYIQSQFVRADRTNTACRSDAVYACDGPISGSKGVCSLVSDAQICLIAGEGA
jgi:hypothetical protein